MNERIQELSYQCWYNDPDTGKEEFNSTKFAQLIVQECIDIVSAYAVGQHITDLKKHFGVAE